MILNREPFKLKTQQKILGGAECTLYALTQLIEGGFTLNEIIRFVYPPYEDDPTLKNWRLGFLLFGYLVAAVPSVWLGIVAYRNRVLALKDHYEQGHHQHNCMHTLQHALMYAIAGTLGFAAVMNSAMYFSGLNSNNPNPAFIYPPSGLGALFNARGFSFIHQHAVDESSEKHGLLSSAFLKSLKINFWDKGDRRSTAIAISHLGAFYFAMSEFFEQIGTDPLLSMFFTTLRIVGIFVSLAFCVAGMIEANTEVVGLKYQDNNVQILEGVDSKTKKYAFASGITHSLDHVTGIGKLTNDLFYLVLITFTLDTDWLESDNVFLCITRVVFLLGIASLVLKKNAEGFAAMVIASQMAYESWAARTRSDEAPILQWKTLPRPADEETGLLTDSFTSSRSINR